jgi:hypothetical protein
MQHASLREPLQIVHKQLRIPGQLDSDHRAQTRQTQQGSFLIRYQRGHPPVASLEVLRLSTCRTDPALLLEQLAITLGRDHWLNLLV